MLHRIYTEDVNPERIQAILDRCFPRGYTMLNGDGVWRGGRERTLIIEVIGAEQAQVVAAAREIKEANRQQTVLVVEIECAATLV